MRRRSVLIVDEEGLLEKVVGVGRDVVGNGGAGGLTNLLGVEREASGLEDGAAESGVSVRTRKMACICVRLAHGCAPVSISTTRQPSDQMSALLV